ncbi:MAG: hypothetical protein Q4P32_01765 [Micrococcales bacterium]|nr:hypothetical protein [Micrococcales bacterium]
MDWVLGGLPLHALLVHFTVVVIPAAALAVALSAVWPAARRRLGIVTPVLAALALVAVPLTVNAGNWLYERVAQTPDVQEHQEIGTSLLPWAIALFVFAALQWGWSRIDRKAARTGTLRSRRSVRRGVAVVLIVGALISAVGSVVTVVRIGDSGARAVWTGKFTAGP